VELLKGSANLHIIITAIAGNMKALVEIIDTHTNIIRIEKNGDIIYQSNEQTNGKKKKEQVDWSCFSIRNIINFANSVELDDVREIISRQIEYNTTISNEGLAHQYGANIGKTLLSEYGNSIRVRAKAKPAAGSDARMSGCVLPVVINSGSGNQGMTVSLPVIEYANELGVCEEKLFRALVVSNLVAIYLKSGMGRLSAYCGAVSAACGSGAAITYLYGGDYQRISKTITNTLANVSGIVCDGAKPSCAAKIASSVDAAIMAHTLSMKDEAFISGDGIVKDNVEKTIESVGRLARDGMKETDIEVLRIMVEK
jgi:L-cysteine desulfidase